MTTADLSGLSLEARCCGAIAAARGNGISLGMLTHGTDRQDQMDAIRQLHLREAEDELVDYCASIQEGARLDRDHLKMLVRNVSEHWELANQEMEP